MLRYLLCVLTCLWVLPVFAEDLKSNENEIAVLDDGLGDDESLLSDDEPLAFSQHELSQNFKSWLDFGFGIVGPWQYFKVGTAWASGENVKSFHLVNMGGGAFEFSNNLDGTAYFLNTTARSISYSRREYFSSFARFYYEPLVQVNYWTGDIRPKANDTVDDELLSSLTSDYSIYGGTLGIKTGFTWYGEQWSVDIGIIQLSKSMILSESYTNNSSQSRESVRSQISDVLSWSGINVSILYKI